MTKEMPTPQERLQKIKDDYDREMMEADTKPPASPNK